MAKQMSREAMLKRVARFRELRPSTQAFVDTRLPEHQRKIFNVIGRGVTEDPGLAPAIPDARAFNLPYVGADPGKGAALHAHPTVEVFVALTGRWAVYWGDEGEQEVVLEPFDTISIPPGVMRGFRNAGPEHGYLDRKSTRLNSSHGYISYAVFCLKKKKSVPHCHAGVELKAHPRL